MLQLVLDPPDSKVAVTPQIENPLLLLGKSFPTWRVFGTPALAPKRINTELLIASKPLAKGGSGDTAPAANQPSIVSSLIELDPPQPLPNLIVHAVILSSIRCNHVPESHMLDVS